MVIQEESNARPLLRAQRQGDVTSRKDERSTTRATGLTPNLNPGSHQKSSLWCLQLFLSERGQWPEELEEAFSAYAGGDEWSALVRYLVIAEQGSHVACANGAFILRKSKVSLPRGTT